MEGPDSQPLLSLWIKPFIRQCLGAHQHQDFHSVSHFYVQSGQICDKNRVQGTSGWDITSGHKVLLDESLAKEKGLGCSQKEWVTQVLLVNFITAGDNKDKNPSAIYVT